MGVNGGIMALLPGQYQISPATTGTTPTGTNGGVAFHVTASQALAASTATVTDQTLSVSNTYSHPNGVSSLTNISSFRHDINQIGFLPHWQSYRSIHNPYVQPPTTAAALAKIGVTPQQANAFIMSNLDNPWVIFSAAQQYHMTPQMLSDITGAPISTVVGYFTNNGYDTNRLDNAYAADALILRGVGSVHFVIPVNIRAGMRECGLSMAAGGLPTHVLLTNCVFDQTGHLTAFLVNPGSYYTYNNRHGKTAVEGNYINNGINVSGVSFGGN